MQNINEQNKIKIEGNLELNDLFRNIFWQSFKKMWIVFAIFLIQMFSIFLLPLIGKLKPSVNSSPIDHQVSPFAYVLLSLPLLLVLLTVYVAYRNSKKLLKLTDGKFQYSFYENGYDVFSSIGKGELYWNSLQRIQETATDFLLFQQKNRFVVVPKKWFVNAEQITQFRELIRSKLGEKAKLKR